MNAILLLAGIIALGLLIYLFISLVKPEWFG
jgi:K+-transporting ATPase KdpF subunit